MTEIQATVFCFRWRSLEVFMFFTIPVLMYHHVSPAGGMINVSPQHFASQLAALKKAGYRTLKASEFADCLQGKMDGGAERFKKAVVLTFDDGYLNNWVYAHALLQKYGLNAILFAATGEIGQGEVRPHLLDNSGNDLPPSYEHHTCKKMKQEGEMDDVMARWSELRAMEQAGTFEIFSHTHSHRRWDLLCENVAEKSAKLAEDLQLSRQALARELAKSDTEHLCWPQGYYDEDYVREAVAQGFKYLYTTDAYGFNRPHMDSRFIYRISAKNRSGAWLLQRLFVARHPSIGRVYNGLKKSKAA